MKKNDCAWVFETLGAVVLSLPILAAGCGSKGAEAPVVSEPGTGGAAGTGGAPNIITALATGSIHTCAVVNEGVQCWGDNSQGQLGDDSTTDSLAPVKVVGLSTGVMAVTAGTHHTCALVNGGAQCWGSNVQGQKGNDGISNPLVPFEVRGLTTDVSAIAANSYYTCAIAAGAVRCNGYNSKGQTGTKASTDYVRLSARCRVNQWSNCDFNGRGSRMRNRQRCSEVLGRGRVWAAREPELHASGGTRSGAGVVGRSHGRCGREPAHVCAGQWCGAVLGQ